jgi:Leucine-rich repeat (LRR) protein
MAWVFLSSLGRATPANQAHRLIQKTPASLPCSLRPSPWFIRVVEIDKMWTIMQNSVPPKLLAPVPLSVLAAVAISAFALSASEHPTIVNFPGVSLGTLSFIPTKNPPLWNSPNTKAAQAIGRVVVPAGKSCVLYVNYQTASDPTVLAKCKPNQFIGINFNKMPITDAGLASIQNLTGLRALELSDTDIGDAGLKNIAKLRNLEYIDLDSTNISGAGVVALSPLTNMAFLMLARNPIGGQCLKTLATWPQLKILSLKETRLKDSDLSNLAAIPNLMEVDLSNNPDVSASGIQKLATCQTLIQMSVGWTGIKPSDAAAFKKLRHLQRLFIGGDTFVAADEQKWCKALPGVLVRVTESHNSKIPIELFNPRHGNYRLPGQ